MRLFVDEYWSTDVDSAGCPLGGFEQFPFQFDVGSDDRTVGEQYQVLIASPSYIRDAVTADGYVVGRHVITMDTPRLEGAADAVRALITAVGPLTPAHAASELAVVAMSEYEDYIDFGTRRVIKEPGAEVDPRVDQISSGEGWAQYSVQLPGSNARVARRAVTPGALETVVAADGWHHGGGEIYLDSIAAVDVARAIKDFLARQVYAPSAVTGLRRLSEIPAGRPTAWPASP